MSFSLRRFLGLAESRPQPRPDAESRPPRATYVTDADLRIMHVSAGFLQLSGLKAEDILGKTTAELLPRPGVPERRMRAKLHLDGYLNRDGLLVRADGQRIPVRISDTPIFDEEGRITNVIGMVRHAPR